MTVLKDIPAIRTGVPILEDFAWLARNMRPDEIEQFKAFSGQPEYHPDVAARAFAMLRGPAYVLVGRDNLPVLVGGFDPVRPGVYDGWMAGTMVGWQQHGFAITRIARRHIDGMLESEAHRVQITALASRTAAHDWYERGLGMTREATLRGWAANGEDAVVFSKVRR